MFTGDPWPILLECGPLTSAFAAGHGIAGHSGQLNALFVTRGLAPTP